MINKIIIDGVDVSGCIDYQIEANELYPRANYCGSMKNTFCENEPNCYYKQLKRKEESLQELQKAYSKLSQRYENKGWSKEYDELKSELQAEKEKVEELERDLKNAFKEKTSLNLITFEEYQQILEEIKKMFLDKKQ